ncbi:hypothetical protein D9M72_467740 [compost metagenome]
MVTMKIVVSPRQKCIAATPPARRPARPIATSNGIASEIGQNPKAKVSACAVPTNGLKTEMSAAIGRSMRRDQCISVPPSRPRRACVRSNQLWPARRSRT